MYHSYQIPYTCFSLSQQLGEINPSRILISVTLKHLTASQWSATTVQTHYDPAALPLHRTMHFCRVWTKKLHERTKTSTAQSAWWDGETGAGQEGKQSHCWVTVSSLAVTRSLLNSRNTHTHSHTYARRFAELTRRVCRWTRCSSPRLSSRWTLRTSVSPSDAWPAWTWLSDYLKHTHFTSCVYTITRRCVFYCWAVRAAVQSNCLPVKFPPMT